MLQVFMGCLLGVRHSARPCSCGDQQNGWPAQVALIGQGEGAEAGSALPWPGPEPGVDTGESLAHSRERGTFSGEVTEARVT